MPSVTTKQDERLPIFDTAFASPDILYFHHIVDPVEATLRVEVLGPNLAYTFRHDRAKQLLSPSEIAVRLEAKTVGFLSLVGSQRRIVLAWAESGHGRGVKGDILEAGQSLLPNALWTRRVIAVAKQLAVSLRHPYDGSLAAATGRRIHGIHVGSHVEAKLAVHAVHVLLRMFGVRHDANDVSRRALRQLRDARWEDGSRPAFEIYFSRKPCGRCTTLVAALERMTGVAIRLVWKDRLVRMAYRKSALGGKASGDPKTQQPRIDHADEADADEDVVTLDCVDLTADAVVNLVEQDEPADAPRPRRPQAPKNHASLSTIAKPLPATPATEAPWWMTGGRDPASAGHADPGVVERAVTEGLCAALPTPPLSGSKPDGRQASRIGDFVESEATALLRQISVRPRLSESPDPF